MARNLDYKDSNKHARLVEFHESKFYSADFMSLHYTFINVYDTSENILLEFAHIVDEFKGRKWMTSNGDCINCSTLISSLVDSCKEHNGIFIDVYVNDIFKSSPSLQGKRIFRYKMSMSNVMRTRIGGNHEGGVELLYNLDAVSDMKCFYDFNQMMNEL